MALLLPAVLLAAASISAQTGAAPAPPTNVESARTQLPVCDPDHPEVTTRALNKCSPDATEYVRVVQSKVQRGWYSLIGGDAWMKRACAVVDFTIRPDGGILSLKIPRSTGDLQLDRAALGGIVSAAPFAPTPPGCDRGLNVRFRLYYNPGPVRRAISAPNPAAGRTTAPDDEPIMHDQGIVQPVLVYSPNSQHAPVVVNASNALADDGAKGRVILTAVVTSKGDVASAKIVSGGGNGIDENAMAMVVMSKFKPATLAGIPVRAEVTLRVDMQ